MVRGRKFASVERWKFMSKPRHMLLLIATYSVACVGIAYYLQHYLNIAPCSWCVMQRYVFLMIATCCLVGWALPTPQIPSVFALLFSLSGLGLSGWQIWTSARPSLTCGADVLEDALNHFVTARWFPSMFAARGSCAQEKVILGLTTPQWAIVAFLLVSLALVHIIIQTRARRRRV